MTRHAQPHKITTPRHRITIPTKKVPSPKSSMNLRSLLITTKLDKKWSKEIKEFIVAIEAAKDDHPDVADDLEDLKKATIKEWQKDASYKAFRDRKKTKDVIAKVVKKIGLGLAIIPIIIYYLWKVKSGKILDSLDIEVDDKCIEEHELNSSITRLLNGESAIQVIEG